MTFSSLGLGPEPVRVVFDKSCDSPTSIQAQAITLILDDPANCLSGGEEGRQPGNLERFATQAIPKRIVADYTADLSADDATENGSQKPNIWRRRLLSRRCMTA